MTSRMWAELGNVTRRKTDFGARKICSQVADVIYLRKQQAYLKTACKNFNFTCRLTSWVRQTSFFVFFFLYVYFTLRLLHKDDYFSHIKNMCMWKVCFFCINIVVKSVCLTTCKFKQDCKRTLVEVSCLPYRNWANKLRQV